jgi:EAL domain-containing protein (putative c-di-GMP-specific phosphodiesterase class I)/ActR/RegA family two-component response regulator
VVPSAKTAAASRLESEHPDWIGIEPMAVDLPFTKVIPSTLDTDDPSASRRKAKRRILIVDDEEVIGRFFTRVLNDYDVQYADSGARAETFLEHSSYDVIVSDIAMPTMDGIQFLRKVRRSDLDVPVILLTGSPQIETAIEALEHGALRYLVKPVEPAQLKSVVAYAVQIHDLAQIKREAMGLLGEKARAASDRAALGASVDRAFDSLWMAFQPIVRWSERKIVAYEALLRTREPAFRHPGAMLEAARDLGRLHELGRRVRSSVARAIATLDEPVRVFVNLHPLELGDDDLYSTSAPLSSHARRVVLEITERENLERVADTTARLERLRAMGYQLAVDDLGAGYSGLTSFIQLNPEIVKIDMALIRGVHQSEPQQRLVRSIFDVCRGMGIEAVAEGVESHDERLVLRNLGGDLMQGYLFSAPAEPFASVRPDVFPPTRHGLLRFLGIRG